MPPQRGSQFTQSTGAQAFIDNLLMGANIRQGEKERDVANRIDQQTITQNDQLIAAEAARVAQEKELAQENRFRQEEELRNAAALGTVRTTPGKENFQSGTNLSDLPIGLGAIEKDTVIARDYRGAVELTDEEVNQRRQANLGRLDQIKQTKIAEKEGDFEYQTRSKQNAIDAAKILNERAVEMEGIRQNNRVLIADEANKIRKEIANIQAASRPGSSSTINTPEDYQSFIEEYGMGTMNTLEMKRAGLSSAEIAGVVQGAKSLGFTNLTNPQRAQITKDRTAAATFGSEMVKFNRLIGEMSQSDNPTVAALTGGFEKARSSIGLPSETMSEFKEVLGLIMQRTAEIDSRPSDRDVQSQVDRYLAVGTTHATNIRRTEEMQLAALDKVRKRYNVNDQQFDLMFAGTDFEGLEELRSRVLSHTQEDSAEIEQVSQAKALQAGPLLSRGELTTEVLGNSLLMDKLEANGVNVEDYVEFVLKKNRKDDANNNNTLRGL